MKSLDQRLDLLEQELGIVVSEPQRAVLTRQMPEADREQLLGQLTNGQTYFFRHPDQCEAFELHLRTLDPVIPLKVWSAGCSTGCEAYSIVMMLDKARRQGRVLGTDISTERLREAEAGLFRESRMLRVSPPDRERYFVRIEDGLWQVSPVVKASATFALENLTQSTGPGMSRLWDVIFCRNVLIYFPEAVAREILGRLVSRLEVGGILVLGFPEAFFGLQHPELALMTARSAIFSKVDKLVAASVASVDLPRPTLPVATRPGPFQEGLRLHAMGRLEEARRQFREAEDIEPDLSLIHYFSARLHDELCQKPQAVSSLRKFFATYRDDDPEVLAFTARNGLTLSQLSQAAARLRERLESDPL